MRLRHVIPNMGFSGSGPRPSRKGENDPLTLNQRVVYSLGYDVGQQAEEAGALDRLGEFALLLLGNGRDARRYDLAALGNVALQEANVLVVDPRCVGAREGAGLAARSEEHTSELQSLMRIS